MIFGNIRTIFENNYKSLIEEINVSPKREKPLVISIFGLFPIFIGAFLGWISPISGNLLVGLVSVVSVMTGFSINAIVLLIGHSEENSYELETKIVDQTKDYTLYSIVVGIFTLFLLLLGYILVSSDLSLNLNGLRVYSMGSYGLLIHYFLGLFVIAHRLFSLVKGGALED